jgi:uncharacterized protein YchJ
MNCSKCGNEIPAGSGFCTHCGAATGAAATAAQPPQGQVPSPPPGGTVPPSPGQSPPPVVPEKKGSALPWILGVLGVAAVVAIVLVLVFVVFKGGGKAASVEQVVNTYFEALEQRNVDLYLSTWEPDKAEEYDREFAEEYLKYLPEDLKFNNLEYDIEIDGDEATVQIVGGIASYIDPSTGKEVTEDAAFVDIKPLKLVKIDDKWYITSDYMEDL